MEPNTPQLHPHTGDLSIVTAALIKRTLPVEVAIASIGKDPSKCPCCRQAGVTYFRGGLRFACPNCNERGSALAAIRFLQRNTNGFRVRMICGALLFAQAIRRHRENQELPLEDHVGNVARGESTHTGPMSEPFFIVAKLSAALRRRSHSASIGVLQGAITDLEGTLMVLRDELSFREPAP